MSDDLLLLEVTIERLPFGNFIIKNERGSIIGEVISGSKSAKFIEKQLERPAFLQFTLRVGLKKP